LDPEDEATCRVITGEPTLLFANRHDLRQLHLYTGRYRLVIDGMRSAIAIDYDYHNKAVLWTDISSENISRVVLDESGMPQKTEVLISTDVHTPDGLAYDWIHHNLYWTDAGRDCIEVAGLYPSTTVYHRKTLVNTNLDEPRAIVVDPRQKYKLMYWTDWGSEPKIERANMDGTDRQVIVRENILWPNGLTLDLENNRLFWVDAKLHVIFSSNFEGQERRVLLTSYKHLQHPFSIAVFEDDIYWTDWHKQMIYKVNRLHGHDINDSHVQPVARNLLAPMGIRIHHSLKQPLEMNLCETSKCSHLCLATPRFPYYACACPNDTPGVTYTLVNHQTCVANTPRFPIVSDMSTVLSSSVTKSSQPHSEPTSQQHFSFLTIVLTVTAAILLILFVLVSS
jgi:hypothetical protein